jgi:hypothetical protein
MVQKGWRQVNRVGQPETIRRLPPTPACGYEPEVIAIFVS